MKTYVLLNFEHKNDITVIVKLLYSHCQTLMFKMLGEKLGKMFNFHGE